MRPRTSAFIAASVDGFIARSDDGLDWLTGGVDSGEDYGYAEHMAGTDVLLLGRRTFEKVLGFRSWPYAGRRVIVLSTSLPRACVPEALRDGVFVHAGPLADLLHGLGSAGCKSLYVDGGRVIQSFLAAGLLDEITITRIPILIGSGIPLFAELGHDVRLEHARTRVFDNGFVQTRYVIQAP
jgi:dihydrofolate reductase